MIWSRADQLASRPRQEEQQFHGNPLQLENSAIAAQFIGAQIELEIVPKPNLVCHFDRVGNHKGWTIKTTTTILYRVSDASTSPICSLGYEFI